MNKTVMLHLPAGPSGTSISERGCPHGAPRRKTGSKRGRIDPTQQDFSRQPFNVRFPLTLKQLLTQERSVFPCLLPHFVTLVKTKPKKEASLS